MRSKLFIGAVVVCLAFSSSAFATLITFSGSGLTEGRRPDVGPAPLGGIITNQFAGVTFSIANGVNYLTNTTYVPFPGTTNPFMAVNTTGNSAATPAVLTVTFDGLGAYGSSISVNFWDTEGNVLFQAYDAGDVLRGTQNYTSTTSALVTFPTAAAFHIKYLKITDTGGDGHSLDDLNFVLVPEPGTFALLGSALLGLGLLKFRRRDS